MSTPRSRWTLLVALLVLLPLIAATRPLQAAGRPFAYGANIAGVYTDQPRLMTLVNTALATNNTTGGRPWVRQQLAWQYSETKAHRLALEPIDQVVNAAAAKRINVLLSIAKSPSWATANGGNGMPSRAHFADFGSFVQRVAQRYKGKVQAYQIWNEQNYALENGGTVQPASYYIDLLAVAYDAIKAVDPGAIVVSGALTPTATNCPTVAVDDLVYYRQLFGSATFWKKNDIVGVHAAGTLNPPTVYAPHGPGPGWQNSSEFYFTRVESIRRLMVNAGYSGRKVWITEFGWALHNVTPGYEYGEHNSPAQQATYIQQAFMRSRSTYAGWVSGMFVWNMNFAVTAGRPYARQDQMAAFSLLNVDWSPRPAFTTVQKMTKR